MTRIAVLAIALLVVIAGILFFVIPAKAPTTSGPGATTTPQTASIPDLIVVNTPTIDANVSSPLAITGEARGNFYFEASFPVKLLDAGGNILAQAPAQAQSDWMTTAFVPFSITLTFPAQPTGSKGTLVLKNDNPSGDPAKDKTLSIPVVFK